MFPSLPYPRKLSHSSPFDQKCEKAFKNVIPIGLIHKIDIDLFSSILSHSYGYVSTTQRVLDNFLLSKTPTGKEC